MNILYKNKYKKQFIKNWKNFNFNYLFLGNVGLRVLDSGRLTIKQLETIRRSFVRLTKREGKFILRAFINQNLTKKSKGSRMGKGVGSLEDWCIDVKPGQIIFELVCFDEVVLNTFFKSIKKKLPVKTEIVFRFNRFINV